MYPLLFSFLLLFYTVTPKEESAIRIKITGLRNQKGHVLINLFNGQNGYPDNAANAFRKARVEINGSEASVKFTDLPAGKYAFAVLHDENDDGVMNKTGVGIPKEGYGFSNNVTGAFGPPSWKRAGFSHNKNETIQTVRIRY